MKDTIKIGIAVALTGEAATYGEDIMNTIRFANRVVANNRYALVLGDTKCSGKESVSVAHKTAAESH